MDDKLKILYHYLMLSFQAERIGWRKDYENIVIGVSQIRERLLENEEYELNSPEVYAGNDRKFPSWDSFLNKMFANTGNGVSSNGQSIFSNEMYQVALKNSVFQNNLKQLIINPTGDNHEKFRNDWYKIFKKNNPVQTNRATAACKLGLSSTVGEAKFNIVFTWFLDKELIPKYDGKSNWYDKNIFLIDYLRGVLLEDEEFKNKLEKDKLEIDEYWVNIFVWLAYENIANPFSLKKQIVKYGAPGTGKTHNAQVICKLQFDLWKGVYGKYSNLTLDTAYEFVQFHPTYSYEDFIEGLRPIPVDGSTRLKLSNGIFKNLCIKAGKWEVDLYSLDFDPDTEFEDWTLADVDKLDKNIFLKNHWKFVKDIEDRTIKVSEVLPPFFIVIDEINRAELSAVFGELMYALEYRGAKNSIKTQYAELNDEDTGILEVDGSYEFFVPHNVYVVGTMNTIDRSVDTFDFALRRRFKWEEVHPDYDLLRMHISEKYKQWVGIEDNLKKLNDAIEKESLLGKDYRIGHAYFMNLKYPKDLSLKQLKEQIWEDSLESLFEEYLRGAERPDLLETFKNEFGV